MPCANCLLAEKMRLEGLHVHLIAIHFGVRHSICRTQHAACPHGRVTLRWQLDMFLFGFGRDWSLEQNLSLVPSPLVPSPLVMFQLELCCLKSGHSHAQYPSHGIWKRICSYSFPPTPCLYLIDINLCIGYRLSCLSHTASWPICKHFAPFRLHCSKPISLAFPLSFPRLFLPHACIMSIILHLGNLFHLPLRQPLCITPCCLTH